MKKEGKEMEVESIWERGRKRADLIPSSSFCPFSYFFSGGKYERKGQKEKEGKRVGRRDRI